MIKSIEGLIRDNDLLMRQITGKATATVNGPDNLMASLFEGSRSKEQLLTDEINRLITKLASDAERTIYAPFLSKEIGRFNSEMV